MEGHLPISHDDIVDPLTTIPDARILFTSTLTHSGSVPISSQGSY
jgi:hypothetical protein